MPAADRCNTVWWSALALIVLAVPCNVHAQAEPLALSWSAPPGCPRAQQVLSRVRKLAGTLPADAPPLRAEAFIERASDDVLHLRLVTHAGGLTGQRHVEGKQCEDLANTVAIHLALLLRAAEPDSAAGPAVAAPPTATPADTAQAPAADGGDKARVGRPIQAAAPDQAADSPRSVFGLLQLPLLVVGIGPAPRVSPGLALAGGVQIARVRVFLEGQAWLSQQLGAAQAPDLGAELDRVSANLRGCRAFGSGRWELAPCVLLTFEHLWASGQGSHLAPRRAQASWIAAGAGAQLRFALATWLGVVARVDAQLELSRPRISVDRLGTIGQLGPAAITLSLGTEWIL